MSSIESTVAEPVTSSDGADGASRPRRTGRIGRAISAAPAILTDAGVLAFALWTVLYHAAFLVDLAPSVTVKVWLASCLLLAGYAAFRAARRGAAVSPENARAEVVAPPYQLRWLTPVLAAAVVAAVTAGMRSWGLSWWVTGVFGVIAAAGAMFLVRSMWLSTPADAPAAPPVQPWQAGYALVLSVLAAISSLFLARNTPDDVFYVGKSVWVAERDEVPLRDFLFTEGVAPPLSTQPPISSIEVLAGAFGRAFEVHAASVTWYLMLPVLAVLAVLALWRLVHLWAPRRPVLVFTVAVAFLGLVAGSDAALGTFHLPRLHEGKGMFVSAVVPLLWVYLSEWFDSRSKWRLFMIFALSIGAIGLTSTAAIILPLLVAAAALGMFVVMRWRDALVCVVAAVAYPIGAVLVSRVVLGPVTPAAATTQFFDAEGTYARTLQTGVLGVICGLALWCGPLLARRRTPALLAAGAAVMMSVLLVPGVLEAMSAVTGLDAVLWRVPWIVPLPALVGLLCAVEVPRSIRAPLLRGSAVVGLAVALVAAFAVLGTPMWSRDSYVEVHSKPVWKLPQHRQRVAFWIWEQPDRPAGLLLAPSTIMRTIPIVTSEVRVVMAREGYLVEYGWDSQFSQDRRKLSAFADGTEMAPLPELAAAMDRLDVTTICVWSGNHAARDAAVALGFEEFASRERPGMHCFRRAT